jgi:hypothetical protein
MIGLSAGSYFYVPLPAGQGKPDRVVSASEVLAKIKSGEPVEFENCVIVGELNLSGLKVGRPVHFNQTTFRDKMNFEYATFNGDAIFTDSIFNRTALFQEAAFNRTAFFDNSTFNDYAQFWGSEFNGQHYSYFVGSKFNSTANFQYSKFNGVADFLDAYFNDSANFEDNAFGIDVDAIFTDVVFKGNTSFGRSQFKGDALFENTTFKGKLSLTRTRYGKFFIRWHDIRGGLTYDDAAYMSLLKNFKDLGYFEDYDSRYFQYRKAHRGQPWPLVSGLDLPIRKGIDVFLEWFYGYGTKPLNAFYCSLATVIAFGIFWKAIGLGGPDDVTGESDKEWEKPDGIFDVLSFSTTIFLSGTKLFIDPPNHPEDQWTLQIYDEESLHL